MREEAPRVTAPPTTDPMAAMLHRLTRQANEVDDVDVVLAAAVRDVCATLRWPAGAAYRHGADEPVEGTAVGRAIAPVEGLRSRACEAGRPLWEQNGEGPDVASTVVVPILSGTGPLGALQFMAPSIDGELGPLLGTIGWQLGMVVQRQEDRRELERRETALERSNQELERFAYVASHDLQEPLRKVVTACEFLDRRHAEELSDDAARYLGIAVDGARRMQQLIRDLLAYSRLAGGDRPDDARTDLAAVLDDVLEELSLMREETGTTLDVGDLPMVALATDEARQVLTNLISNAMKYHGDAPPRVEVAAEDRQDGMVEVTVCDNGIGIDPAYHERIFDVFRRLHRRDEFSGTGIGLAIVKRIAEHNGGRVWASSRPSGGTCFHLLLPRTDAS